VTTDSTTIIGEEPLAAASGIVVRQGGELVLDQVDIAVAPGERLTIIGPNGAGKTTLLRVMLGLIRPAAGVAVLRSGLRIGYVPQKFPLDPTLPMTVDRFLRLGVRADTAVRQRRLAEVGASELGARPLERLSGGELRRMLLARALLRDPELLVLDEPVQGVDLSGQIELYSLISRIADERQCSVIMVSHDLHFVMAATDRVVCLNCHICCEGEPESVRNHPEVRSLLGPAAPGVAVYTHEHDHVHGVSGEVMPVKADLSRGRAVRV